MSGFDPPLTLREEGGNTEVIAIDKLRDSTATPEFDLHLDWQLGPALFWMEPGNVPESGNAEFMRATFQAGLDLEYLVVYRTSNYVAAKIIDRTEFLPASIDVEVFVFTLGNKELQASFSFTAVTPDSVTVFVNSDQSADDRIPATIHSALWEDARMKLTEQLEAAGATVKID